MNAHDTSNLSELITLAREAVKEHGAACATNEDWECEAVLQAGKQRNVLVDKIIRVHPQSLTDLAAKADFLFYEFYGFTDVKPDELRGEDLVMWTLAKDSEHLAGAVS